MQTIIGTKVLLSRYQESINLSPNTHWRPKQRNAYARTKPSVKYLCAWHRAFSTREWCFGCDMFEMFPVVSTTESPTKMLRVSLPLIYGDNHTIHSVSIILQDLQALSGITRHNGERKQHWVEVSTTHF